VGAGHNNTAAGCSDLKADGMLRQLEDAYETDDSEKCERRAGLGAGAAHRRQYVEQRHVVRNDGHHVHHVLEVRPEGFQKRGRRDGL